MKYTVSNKADEKIEKDLKFICKEVRKNIPSVISIFLTGGFSRGEGPVKIEKNKVFPYNDYDIQVICKQKISKDEVDRISNKISKRLGYRGIEYFYSFKKEDQKMKENFYIDLKCNTPKEIKNLLPRIRTYELKHNSSLLDGQELRHIIPNFNLKDVPLTDTGKLLLDRLSQLVQYFSIKGKYEREFLSFIIQQAYASCCTSLLLLKKKYKIGYKKSMLIFKKNYKKDYPELYKKIPDLDKKIEEYISWKINPKKPRIKDIEKEWYVAKRNILMVIEYFFSRFLNKDIKNLEELSKAISKMKKEFYIPYINEILRKKLKIKSNCISFCLLPFVSLILKYKYYKRLKKFGINKFQIFFKDDPGLIIFSSLIYIADSIRSGVIDYQKLQKGQKILNKAYSSKSKNWEKISIDYGNAYIAFFLQKI